MDIKKAIKYILIGMIFALIITSINITQAQSNNVNPYQIGIKSSVLIRNYKNDQLIGTGSGFAIDDKHIITCNHVLQNGTKFVIKYGDCYFTGGRAIYKNIDDDLAIIEIYSSIKLTAMTLGDSRDLELGDNVYMIGNPFGLENSASFGIISGFNRKINGKGNYIQFTAPTSPGNSGCMLMNKEGEVIGVVRLGILGSSNGQNVNFAIPIEKIKNVLKKIKE